MQEGGDLNAIYKRLAVVSHLDVVSLLFGDHSTFF